MTRMKSRRTNLMGVAAALAMAGSMGGFALRPDPPRVPEPLHIRAMTSRQRTKYERRKVHAANRKSNLEARLSESETPMAIHHPDKQARNCIRRMTNWQLTKWQRDGSKTERAMYFSGLKRRAS